MTVQQYLCIFLSFCFSASVATVAQIPTAPTGNEESPTTRTHGLEMLDEVAFEASNLPPLSRAVILTQLASIHSKSNPDKAKTELIDAIEASRSINDAQERWEKKVRAFLMLWALDRAAAEKNVDDDTKPIIAREEFIRAVSTHDYASAFSLLDTLAAYPSFPFHEATQLMLNLPLDLRSERSAIFAAALKSFKREDNQLFPQMEDIGTWLLRFSADVPKSLTLEAIKSLLDQAKELDKTKGITMTVGTPDGQSQFSDTYQLRLFEVLPVLKKLDEGWAKTLLDENPKLKEALQGYPNGLASLQPDYSAASNSDRPKVAFTYSFKKRDQARVNSPLPNAEQEFKAIQQIVELSTKDLDSAISRARALPIEPTSAFSPRASALVGIFDVQLAKRDKNHAKSVLAVLLKELGTMPPVQRVRYLDPAIRQVRRLMDNQAMIDAIQLELDSSADLLKQDMNEKDPNVKEKVFWPSTVSYQAAIYTASKFDPVLGEATVRVIPDIEVRTFAKLSLSSALLGLPPLKTELMSSVHKETAEGFNSMSFTPVR